MDNETGKYRAIEQSGDANADADARTRLSMAAFKRLIADQFGIEEDKLTEETDFLNDLGIDSLSLINFVIAMEKKYGVKVQMDTVFRLRNIRDAYDVFTGKTGWKETTNNHEEDVQ